MSNSRDKKQQEQNTAEFYDDLIPAEVRKGLKEHGFNSVTHFLDIHQEEFWGKKDPLATIPEIFYAQVLQFLAVCKARQTWANSLNPHIPSPVRKVLGDNGIGSIDELFSTRPDFAHDPVEATPAVFYSRVISFFDEKNNKSVSETPTSQYTSCTPGKSS